MFSRFHKIICTVVLLVCSVLVHAQFTTIVRINDSLLIPSVDSTFREDGVKLVSSNLELNEILQTFTFFDFQKLDSQSSNPVVKQYYIFRFYSTGNRNRFRNEMMKHFGNAFSEWTNIFGNYDYEVNNRRIKIVAENSDELYALSFNISDFNYMLNSYKSNVISETDIEVFAHQPKLDSVIKTFSIRALIRLTSNKYYLKFGSKDDMTRFSETVATLFPNKFTDIHEFSKSEWRSSNLFANIPISFCEEEDIKFFTKATFLDEFGRPIPKLQVQLMDSENVHSTTNRKGQVSLSSFLNYSYKESYYPHYLIVSDVDGAANGHYLTDTIYLKSKIGYYELTSKDEEENDFLNDRLREFSSHIIYTVYPASKTKLKKNHQYLVSANSKQYNQEEYVVCYNADPYFKNKVGTEETIRRYLKENRKDKSVDPALDWKFGDVSEFSFVIDRNGKIVRKSIKLVSGGDFRSPKNREFVRLLLTMPRWQPAVRDGLKVDCRCRLRIEHQLTRTSNVLLQTSFPE